MSEDTEKKLCTCGAPLKSVTLQVWTHEDAPVEPMAVTCQWPRKGTNSYGVQLAYDGDHIPTDASRHPAPKPQIAYV